MPKQNACKIACAKLNLIILTGENIARFFLKENISNESRIPCDTCLGKSWTVDALVTHEVGSNFNNSFLLLFLFYCIKCKLTAKYSLKTIFIQSIRLRTEVWRRCDSGVTVICVSP